MDVFGVSADPRGDFAGRKGFAVGEVFDTVFELLGQTFMPLTEGLTVIGIL